MRVNAYFVPRMTMLSKMKMRWQRLTSYEFWPFGVFYAPLYPYGLYLAARARSFTYFTATNPAINNSGVVHCSKYDILQRIAPQYLPLTVCFDHTANLPEVLAGMEKTGITYPIIAKPDDGERGRNVEKILNEAELRDYLSVNQEPFMVQEYINAPLELGVFYYKYPGESTGHINSVVIKGFLEVVGDGVSTLKELIHGHLRTQTRLDYLERKFQHRLQEVLPAGEKLMLEPIGNHARGTTFLNGNHLINDQLVKVFDVIGDIDGVYYGRYDIRVSSIEDLYAGRNIKLMELNGVSSEPAHVYDPAYNLWDTYKDLKEHFDIVYRISRMNHENGVPYKPLRAVLADLFDHFYPQAREEEHTFKGKLALRLRS